MDYQEEYIKLNPTLHVDEAEKKYSQLLPQLNFVEKRLTAKSILDIGCGAGAVTDLVKQKFPTTRIYGIDLSQPMINYAKKHNKHSDVSFKCHDIFNLDPSLQFDFIYCSDLIEHVEDDVTLLKKLAKHSKYFLIRVPLENSISNRFLRLFKIYDEFAWTRNKYGHLHHYSLNELRNKARKAGFTIVNHTVYPIDHVRKHLPTEIGRKIAKVLFNKVSPELEVLFGGGFVSLTLQQKN